MHVELVAPDRNVWSGDATMIIARTIEGDLGILPGHVSLLGVVVDGAVEIHPVGEEPIHFAVYGGFISVNDDVVSMLAEHAERGADITAQEAEAELRAAESSDDVVAQSRARARLQAATGRSR